MMPETKHNTAITVDFSISCPHWRDCGFDVKAKARQTVEHILRYVSLDACDMELSIVLTSDSDIRSLNRQYRGKDKPTNVLSFPAWEPDLPGPALLGDIILAFETIAQESRDQGKEIADHYTHLIVHGFLHLLGYDHETEGEAEIMEGLEIKILETLGIENPYKDS